MEGGELDSHEEISPEEIKSRRWCWAGELGLLSLQLFPNGGATDIVFVTLFRTTAQRVLGTFALFDEHCL